MKRNYRIDNLRALAIIMVVLGHSMILYQSGWQLYITDVKAPFFDKVKNLIDMIQMPLFISMSGFLCCYSIDKTNIKKMVFGKAKRLLVPYICIAFAWMIPIRILANYSSYKGMKISSIIWHGIILGNNNGHLWFLPFLYISFLIFYFQYFLLKKASFLPVYKYSLLLINGLLLYLEWWRIPDTFLLKSVITSVGIWYIWFVVGFFICKLQQKKDKLNVKIIIVIDMVAIFIIVIYSVEIFTNLLIVRLIVLIAVYYSVPNKKSESLSFLGDNSFGIYLFHSPMIYLIFDNFSNANPLLVVAINFFLLGGFALVMTIMIKRTKYLKFIIGE